jgi:transposase-like protein
MCRLNNLIDERKCEEEVSRIRWPNGVCGPACTSNKITQRGRNHRQQECRRHTGKNCGKRFDDLTGTLFMGRHQPWSVWFAYRYLMGLKVSNRPIADELHLNESDGQAMANEWRGGIVKRRSNGRMSGVVEGDEVYVVAGHKGRPEKIKGRRGRRRRLKGAPGRGTLEKEKPPIFGMIERGGEVRIFMLENVQQHTLRPFIKETIEPGTVVNTDESVIDAALPQWGYVHQSVCHSRGE